MAERRRPRVETFQTGRRQRRLMRRLARQMLAPPRALLRNIMAQGTDHRKKTRISRKPRRKLGTRRRALF